MVTRLLILLMLLCSTVHATITVTARGTTTDNTASSSWTLGPSTTIAAGSIGVLCIATDNTNSIAMVASATDSAGNVWYRLGENLQGNGNNAGSDIAIYWAHMTTALVGPSSGTVTITFVASPTAKTAAFWELAPSAGNRVLPISNPTAGTIFNGTNFAGSAVPTITTGINVGIGQVTIGMLAIENGTDSFAADAGTTNGTWSTAQHTSVGSTTNGMCIGTQYKIQTTAASTQTYAPTCASNDLGIAVMTFTETDLRVRTVLANGTSQTSTVITPRVTLATGSMGVLCTASDNTGGTGGTTNIPSSITDSVSNTWTRQVTGIYNPGSAAGSGTELGIYTAPITTAITPSDNITFNFPTAVINKSMVLWQFSPAGAGSMSYVSTNSPAIGTGVTTGTPSITTGSIANGDIVIAMGGIEGTNTWVADTGSTNGTWGTATMVGWNTGTSGMAIISQAKTVTATATQTYAPTVTSGDLQLGWISIHDSSVVTASTGAFFQFWP